MERREINPWPWSLNFGFQQAVEVTGASRTLYCAGQTAADGEGNLRAPGDMAAQLQFSWENLETVLAESDYQPADIIRLLVYVTDIAAFMSAYGALGERMAKAGVKTSMTLVGVDALAFDGQVCELEATAAR